MNDLDDNGVDADPSSTWILLQIGDSGEDFAVLSCALGISAGESAKWASDWLEFRTKVVGKFVQLNSSSF